MSDEATNIRRKAGNWTPQEALEFALDDIKEGKLSPSRLTVVVEHEVNPGDENSQVQFCQYSSQMVTAEYLALLRVAEIQGLQDWLGPLWAGRPQS